MKRESEIRRASKRPTTIFFEYRLNVTDSSLMNEDVVSFPDLIAVGSASGAARAP